MMLSHTFHQDGKAYGDDHKVCYAYPLLSDSFEFPGVSVTDSSTLFL